MNSLKLLVIIAIVGAIAGFGILSNDILLNAQTITVWDNLDAFTGGHTCECDLDEPDCDDLSANGQALCTP